MDWTALTDRLEAALTIPKLTLPCGTVFVCEGILDLDKALTDLVPDEDGREDVRDVLGGRVFVDGRTPRGLYDALVTFEWQSGGPMSWFMSLSLINVGRERQFVRLLQEEVEHPDRIIAALQPRHHPALIAAFFKDLLAENGAAYQAELFGSLPSATEHDRPDLLSFDAIKKAYRGFLQWADMHGFDVGEELDLDNLHKTFRPPWRQPGP